MVCNAAEKIHSLKIKRPKEKEKKKTLPMKFNLIQELPTVVQNKFWYRAKDTVSKG